MNSLNKKKLLICGGGIIGITVAREAALSKKYSEITVLEKDNTLGSHSSTRNSGVIHAGFYYSPDSYKAKLCSIGNKLMREYCLKNKIKLRKCGKVVVTKDDQQEDTLKELYNRGMRNGCSLEIFDKINISDYEPLASTYKNFLWSPNTWSISPYELFNFLTKECESLGIKFIKGEKIKYANNNYLITFKNKKYYFDYLINACGGFSLEVSKLFGVKTDFKLLPFKGLYLKSSKKSNNFSTHIYPVPDINQPFLGIHTTITVDNYLKLGPTAIPALSPENYTLFEGLEYKLSKEIISLQIKLLASNEFGFRDLAFREIKYLIKDNILKKARALTTININNIKFEWHSPGIRAQLYNSSTKKLENDFVLVKEKNTFHVLNSISPAWSCSFVTAKNILKAIENS